MDRMRVFTWIAIPVLLLPGSLRAQWRDSGSSPAGQPAKVVQGLYFVSFHDGVQDSNRRMVQALGNTIRWEFPEVRTVAVRIPNPYVLAALRSLPTVEYVEEVPLHHKLDLSNQQLTPSLDNGLYGLITTRAVDVQTRGFTGTGVRIGIADTGLDCGHPDIAANYSGGFDAVDDDTDPCVAPNPNEAHGTHVSGTALGVYNSVGIFGVAYGAQHYHARVLGPTGSGSSADVMMGVKKLVVDWQCKVVNLSLGGGSSSRTEQRFYAWIRSQGALVVAASGNDGATSLSYPAAYPSNVSVGAVDRNNTIADFSNRGTGLHVVAPGVDVLSSVPVGQGREASVISGSTTYQAFPMEYAGTTAGFTANLVDCGIGQANQCGAGIAGNIALIQRGTLSFSDKVYNAMQQGAAGAIVYNNAAGSFQGTLGTPAAPNGSAWIPAVSVTDVAGAALVANAGHPAVLTNKTSDWDIYSGTSMATPHVTGTVALIWAVNPALTNDQVEAILVKTATDLGTAGYDTTYGNGIVNAALAAWAAGR